MIIINLGCGNKPLDGALNHDRTKHAPWVDVAHDLGVYPWPCSTNSADQIMATDVLEHLDSFIGFFDECWRILKPGGTILVQVPRYDHVNVAIDPTHKRGYHPESFDYLDPGTSWGTLYGMYTDRKWTKLEVTDGDNITAKLQPIKEAVQP